MRDVGRDIQRLSDEWRRRLVAELPLLSFAQQRIWLLHQLDPTKAMYNVRYIVRALGVLDLDALRHAAAEVRRRHAVLRTTFHLIDNTLYQVIRGETQSDFVVVDISDLASEERVEETALRIEAEFRKPLDLERGPLFRTVVLRSAAREHTIIFVFHHLVIDGRSMTLFTDEITELYQARVAGRPPNLPALPIQYADYVAWQRQAVEGPLLINELSYWRDRLSNCPLVSGLPPDHPRSPLANGSSESLFCRLDTALAGRISMAAAARGCTRYMLLLAAFAAVLGRIAGSSDICIGSPVAGRVRREFEPLIGCFLNTLVMRFKLSREMTFDDLLQQAREVTTGAYANQTVPFERIVEELKPPRDASGTPFFQVMMNMLSHKPRSMVFDELELVPIGLGEPPGGGMDLNIKVQAEANDGIGIFLTYRADLYERSTIVSLQTELVGFLAQVVDRPDLRLGELSGHTNGAPVAGPERATGFSAGVGPRAG
ncbi:condensation domain-containing protein [Bradyrhizobium ontarionense]|uniref:Condensation domain-containing protein n=1 Tax=Bradyrhizobium ontarionense TaxID=2898149 RepID=A0ABY3RPW4_9BRAD|nr:condensation domain-containing protein [Bradyrhizobium sp. A19]UFZ08553.1 condensation domain-containing protein [Bradyrhizobium sp. A19]